MKHSSPLRKHACAQTAQTLLQKATYAPELVSLLVHRVQLVPVATPRAETPSWWRSAQHCGGGDALRVAELQRHGRQRNRYHAVTRRAHRSHAPSAPERFERVAHTRPQHAARDA